MASWGFYLTNFKAAKFEQPNGEIGSGAERAKRGYHTASERHNESKTERKTVEKVGGGREQLLGKDQS